MVLPFWMPALAIAGGVCILLGLWLTFREEQAQTHERRAIEQVARLAARRFLASERTYDGVSLDAEDLRHMAYEIACEHVAETRYAHWSMPQLMKWYVLAFCAAYQCGETPTEKLHAPGEM